MPEAANALTGEMRYQVYKLLRLKVTVTPEGYIDVSGAIEDSFCITGDQPSEIRDGIRRSRVFIHVLTPEAARCSMTTFLVALTGIEDFRNTLRLPEDTWRASQLQDTRKTPWPARHCRNL